MVKGQSRYERELRGMLEDIGMVVTRAAGSFGKWDIHATDPFTGFTPIVEVKATKAKAFYFDARSKEQFWWLKEIQLNCNAEPYFISPMFAIRFKGRDGGWRLFPLREMDEPKPLHRHEGYSFNEAF